MRFEPGKMYRLTEPVRNNRLDHFTGIDSNPKRWKFCSLKSNCSISFSLFILWYFLSIFKFFGTLVEQTQPLWGAMVLSVLALQF